MAQQDPQDNAWGWVDEDGTVHVRLPGGGDAVVGQYAAGDAAAALAFFTRKYDDVVAEIRLTAGRLQSGKLRPEDADAFVARQREALASPVVVGDLAALSESLDALHAAAAERRLTGAAEKARVRAAALADREALAAEAERLAGSTQWKAAGERFKEMLEQWKQLPRFDKKAEDELWHRFSSARTSFDKARKQHFAELDASRQEALDLKLQLVEEAEALAGSTEWAETSRAMKSLMDRWKAAPRAARADEDRLWARFQAARDTFFGARNAQQAERDADELANQQAKEALAERAEALLPVRDARAARAALRDIIAQWEEIGFVPRTARAGLEGRLQKVEDAVARAERALWQRTDPAMRERAERTVAGFRASVAKLEAELELARAAGNEKKARSAEASLEQTRALLEAAERVLAEYQSA